MNARKIAICGGRRGCAMTIAFALAGLGGFNAHGAGFLTAANTYDIKPDLVTATSGQIIVLAEWLAKTDLKTFLIDRDRLPGVLGTITTALFGVHGVFRPAIPEYWGRWGRLQTSPLAKLLPAEELVPLRSPEDLARIARLLNDAPFGVVFNAYDFEKGEPALFGNARAADLLKPILLKAERKGRKKTFEPITRDAVTAALWLSLYGFERLPGGLMDGAYNRPCLVRELHRFHTVFAVRPLARGWSGKRPETWFDVQDWQYEMWFSAGYEAEVAAMKEINELIRTDALKHKDYRDVELIEVATAHPAGYFNFFTERAEVFDAAVRQAEIAFDQYLKSPRRAGPPPPPPGQLVAD
jgi:hypothetical protein